MEALAEKTVVRLAKEALNKPENSHLTYFMKTMGEYFFVGTKTDPDDGFQWENYNFSDWEELEQIAPELLAFMQKWDDKLKLSGEPTKVDRTGQIPW